MLKLNKYMLKFNDVALVPLLLALNISEACNFIKKETLVQVFSYEFCEISKNIFSHRTSPVAVSQYTNAKYSDQSWLML